MVGRDRHFERRVILGIFQRVDDGLCGQPVANGILARTPFALFGDGPRAELRIAAIGLDLSKRGH